MAGRQNRAPAETRTRTRTHTDKLESPGAEHGGSRGSVFGLPVMGDLRSKLRAKFPRRHSGIPPLPSSRSGNESAGSDSAAASPVGVREPDAAPAATAVASAPGASHSGSSPNKQKATRLAGQGTAGISDAVSGSDGRAGGSKTAAVKDAAAMKVANVGMRPSLAGASSDGPDADGSNKNDRRVPTPSSKLESVDEGPVAVAADDQRQQSLTLPPSGAVPTDAVRRIRLSDPPLSSPDQSTTPATQATRPAAPGPPPSSSGVAVDSTSNPNPPLRSSGSLTRPAAPPRRQSLLPNRQTTLIRTLLNAGHADDLDPGSADQLLPISANMVTRKLWVKRPGGSATIVTISEEDLVDDVRDLILRKYANSLGRQYDAPDLTLRIVPREDNRQERVLGPEEPMARTIDAYFPGGQTVDEALLIDVPHRRTPRASPRSGPPHAQHLTSAGYEDARPLEASTDYFGPGAVAHIPVTIAGTNGTTHAISVLNTGQVPQIPSPGGTRTRPYRERSDRPRLGRQHTSSPTILNVVGTGGHTATIAVSAGHGMPHAPSIPRSRTHSNASSDPPNSAQPVPPAPPLPTPPAQETAAPLPVPVPTQQTAATPPPRTSGAPRPAVGPARPKKKKPSDPPALPAGMLNGGVPPINVLIVEDNDINMRLLEAFVKRLKVRWQTAVNGREAVDKWRMGGFHLVLMDIQLPIMSGLEATREIRRLERMNSIGVFSSTPSAAGGGGSSNNNSGGSPTSSSKGSSAGGDAEDGKQHETPEEDKLKNRELFKSPVIIVALTASSLQSDRHEALAAGCNDFLTKVCNFFFLLHFLLLLRFIAAPS